MFEPADQDRLACYDLSLLLNFDCNTPAGVNGVLCPFILYNESNILLRCFKSITIVNATERRINVHWGREIVRPAGSLV